MTILILGAAGNLGTAFTELLSGQADVKVIAWDKEDIDVTDEGLVSKKIVELAPNVIINVVAYNDVDRCETDETAQALARKLNVDLLKSLANAALAIGATLVHYSSDYVFKGDKATGYNEEDEVDPQSVYAQTKADGEKELISSSGKGLHWYLIRTSKLFGPKGTSLAAKPSFFELMKNLSEKNQSIKAVKDETGSFTYTRDLAQATLELIEAEAPYGIYHLVNNGEASWYTAADYFFKKIGTTIELEAVPASAFPRPAPRPSHSLLLNTKRPALRSWQEAIDDYIIKEHFV